jgi:hypothetical protein
MLGQQHTTPKQSPRIGRNAINIAHMDRKENANGPISGDQLLSTDSSISVDILQRIHNFSVATDERGDLVAFEFQRDMPFTPQRFFSVSNVGSSLIRGEHAHKECSQLLVALKGSLRVSIHDGDSEIDVELNRPSLGLHIPPMTWCSQYNFSRGAVLGVFASHPYDANDYIRKFSDFLDAKDG